MRKYAKKDANHAEIVDAAKSLGATVIDLASIGDDCPDLLIGFRDNNYLVEVKDGSKPLSQRRLRPGQEDFFRLWQGTAHKVESVNDLLIVLGVKDGLLWKSQSRATK